MKKIRLTFAFFITIWFVLMGLCGSVQAEEHYVFDRMWPTLQQPWYFYYPHGIEAARDGSIYLADYGSKRVLKFNANGELTTWWGGYGEEAGEFEGPSGVAADAEGFVYVADSSLDRIQKFSPDGRFVTQWGETGDGDGQLDHPHDMAVGLAGDVYVVDSNNQRIQVFSSSGDYVGQWGEWGSGDGQFQLPSRIAMDRAGFVYVTDWSLCRVQKFDANGDFVVSWGSPGSGEGQLNHPTGIAVDGDGFVYVADSDNFRVQKFTSGGAFVTQWGSEGNGDGEFSNMEDIACDRRGRVYVTEKGWPDEPELVVSHRVQIFSSDGAFVSKWDSGGREPGRLLSPWGVATDSGGNVYVVDRGNDRVQKFSPSGAFILEWGGWGSGDGRFQRPYGIALDDTGRVYVTDTGNDRVQTFDSAGSYLGQWGGTGSGQGQFSRPLGMDVDSQGNVYVADLDNHRIQKFDTAGAWLGQWGGEGSGDTQFQTVVDVGVDSGGSVYVVDAGDIEGVYGTDSPAVRKFTADGAFVTRWGTKGRGDGEFQHPSGLALDPDDNVYVIDGADYIHRVQKFTSGGAYLSRFGGPGFLPGLFMEPVGIAFHPASRTIYVTEARNNRVQAFRLLEAPARARAIVVAGGGPYTGNTLWDATQTAASFAYRALAYQGFTREGIIYLSADTDLDLDGNGEPDDVDGDATNANLQDAILSGVTDAESVILYLVDHGDSGQFRMNGTETLSAPALDGWLDTLQSSVTGQVTVIYDACEAGTFLPVLSGASRTVIASTSPGEQAKFVTQGSISFSNHFWTHVYNGETVGDAFDLSCQALAASFDDQNPLLDANGNGVGNETADLDLVANRTIGSGTEIPGDAPAIGSVSGAQTLSGVTAALLTASGVTDPDGIARVWAVIRPPDFDGGGTGNPVLELPSVDLMPQGDDVFEGTYEGFNVAGTYHVAVYARDRAGDTCIPQLTTVSVENPLRRKAVIVAGGTGLEDLWPAVEKSALQAYEALRGQGYADEDIYFLSPVTFSAGVDGTPAWSNVQYALETWAGESCQDVVVCLVGPGRYGRFELNGSEELLAQDLDGWLDGLQEVIPGKVTLIYDASHAGSFLPELTPPSGKKRTVIASAHGAQEASFAAGGDISFTRYFWRHVLNGMDVRDAFVMAKNAIYFARGQQAQLDDNGDGVYSKPDGQEADGDTIGTGILLAGDAPVIGLVVGGQSIYGTPSAMLWAEDVTTTGTIDRVWAVVTGPVHSGVTGTLPSFELTDQGGGTYQGVVSGLTAYGRHGIEIYAMDTQGEVSMPGETYVWQAVGPDGYESDDSPGAANIIVPQAGWEEDYAELTQRHTFHASGITDWVKFHAVSGEAYEIKTDNLEPACDTVITLFAPDGVTPIASRDDYGNGHEELLSWMCLQTGTYYIRVTPYEASGYGPDTAYDMKLYFPHGGIPGWLFGIVVSSMGYPVANAVIHSQVSNTSTMAMKDGGYMMPLPSGSHTITVSAPGYGTRTLGLNVPSNDMISKCFVLEVAVHTIAATATPGGSIDPSGSMPVQNGGDQAFMIAPSAGYDIEDVLVDGGSVGKVTEYTFENVTGDHTIHAVFSGTKGDINGDGDLDAADAVLALEVLAGKSPAGIRGDYATSGSDVNGDGKIGVEEALYVQERIHGLRAQ